MKSAMAQAKAALPPPVLQPYAAPSPVEAQRPLPEFEWVSAVNEATLFEPPPVVEGMLHQGSKLVLGGGSKSYKTWCLCDLAISVAAGVPWIGLPCVKGVVLYVNFEIQPVFFHKRIASICRAKAISKPSNLAVWNLRGHCYDLRSLLPVAKERLTHLKRIGKHPSLIILDPVYKSLGGRDENSAGEIGQLLGEIEALAEQTGAAVAFGAHFSKGNQSSKEAIDRISGSGVFARDPDSILTFTRHEEDESFTVDVTLRNFPRMDPVVVSWDFPLLRANQALDPNDLKRQGGKKAISSSDILSLLNEEGMTPKEWINVVVEASICSRATFYRLQNELSENGQIFKKGKLYFPSNLGSQDELITPES